MNHKSFINIWSVIVETRLCAAELVWFDVFWQSRIEFHSLFYNMNQNYGFKKRKNTENDFSFTRLTYCTGLYCLFFSFWQYQLLEECPFSFQSFHMSSFHRTVTHPWKRRTCKRLLYSTTAEWTRGHSTWLKASGSKVKTKALNPQKSGIYLTTRYENFSFSRLSEWSFNVTWRVNDEVKWQVSGSKIKEIAVFTLTF